MHKIWFLFVLLLSIASTQAFSIDSSQQTTSSDSNRSSMSKTILITGATDGLGLETAKALLAQGHYILVHGRSRKKLQATQQALGGDNVEGYLADLSKFDDVEKLAQQVSQKHDKLDVLVNNAGVMKTSSPITPEGLDVRFVVNTISPYLLTRRLLPLLQGGRVVNLSSAAQSPVNLNALSGKVHLRDDFSAYAQSKLALTEWTLNMAPSQKHVMICAVNPGSMLATNMVREGFGSAGRDITVGVDILCRACTSDEFAQASGKYFDNDRGSFSSPHPDATNKKKCAATVQAIEEVLEGAGISL